MNNIFATDFIIEGLYTALSNFGSPQSFAYQKLVESVQKSRVILKVTENASSRLLELSEKLNSKDEFEQVKYQLLLDWFQSAKITEILISGDKKLDISGIRKGKLRELDPVLEESISSALYKFELSPENERKVISEGKKLLMHDDKFSNEDYSFLFNVKDLAVIQPEDKINWRKYIDEYSVPTSTVRILDPYFIKNNKDTDIRNILGSLIRACPNSRLKVELIFDLEKTFDNPERAVNWVRDQESDRLTVSIYKIRRTSKSKFHDRYLWTQYWSLKIPSGIDQRKITIPTLGGLYAPNNETWSYLDNNWESWIQKDCKKIEDLINKDFT